MISIQLHPDVFLSGGQFYGVTPSRAVLVIGTGRSDAYVGHKQAVYPPGHLSWRGGQHSLQIDSSGMNLSDYMFEALIQNETYRYSYGQQIIDLVERGVIRVYQDAVLLSASSVETFTA